MNYVSQLGRSPMDRALASHHESRGSNPGANKCHAQVRWTICPEPNYARRMVHPLVAPPAQGAGYKKKKKRHVLELPSSQIRHAKQIQNSSILLLPTAVGKIKPPPSCSGEKENWTISNLLCKSSGNSALVSLVVFLIEARVQNF